MEVEVKLNKNIFDSMIREIESLREENSEYKEENKRLNDQIEEYNEIFTGDLNAKK